MAKKKDVMDEVLAFLASRGVDTTDIPTESDTYDYRSNDAVVVFANVPAHFKPGICKNCKKPFAVNKPSVGFCSDMCRREDWKKTTGLEWKAVSTKDVWNGDPPMIITPQQMKNLGSIVEWFNKNRTTLVPVPETNAEPEQPLVLDHLAQDQTNHQDVLLVQDDELWEDMEFRDSQASPLYEPVDEVLTQTSEEVDLFGFS